MRLAKFKNVKCFKGGYTIIETMIAVSLFVSVITLGLGALLNANLLHNKTQDMRSIMDNMSFILEDLARNLRTGTNYKCLLAGGSGLPSAPQSCESGVGIAFTEADGSDQWIYYINGGKMYKSTDSGVSPYVELTPDEVTLTSASFVSVLGAESPENGNRQQPLVIIRLAGTINYKDGVSTPFSLQTAVSQRLVDI